MQLPACQPSLSIESSSQLRFRMNHLPLKESILDHTLTMLRSDSGQPDQLLLFLAIDQNIGRELVPTDMGHEEDAYAAWSLVVRVAV